MNSSCDKESNGTKFLSIDLPEPSYGFIKTLQDFYLCTKFYNGVILKISACAIMLGFRKSGYIIIMYVTNICCLIMILYDFLVISLYLDNSGRFTVD